jgi:hypothetical protein
MLIEFFVINPHITVFVVAFCVGLISLVASPIFYIKRTGKVRLLYSPWEISEYNRRERLLLCSGLLLSIVGIFGAILVSEAYGYKRIVYDADGKRHLEWSTAKSKISPDMMPGYQSEVLVGRTVIPGTWDWDIDSNSIGKDRGKADIWLKHHSEIERGLIPMNGTSMRILTDANYEAIDGSYISRLSLLNRQIIDTDASPSLNAGTVIAVCTSAGNYGKLRVVRFLELHDFSFSGSDIFDYSWRSNALRQPNRAKYHLEIEWTLYRLVR